MGNSHAVTNGRNSGQRQMIPISMMLIMIVALFVLSSCGSNGNGGSTGSSETQASNQPATNILTGDLTDLHMIDATVGWAVSWDIAGAGAYHILRTVDGGVHWKVMLQCSSSQSLGRGFVQGCVSDFHSATVATVLAPEYNSATRESQSRIFHTSDGGQTWRSSVVKARYLETPAVFTDALHGWFLATDHFPGYDPGSDYIGKDIALFRTSDGGNTWQRIASAPATSQLPGTSDDAYGVVPFAASARMQFVTATTGWLAGTSYQNVSTSFCWLYVTHDAGSTWHQVAIPFPAQGLLLWPPRFFTGQEGLLPVLTSGPAPQYARGTMFYTTHDGGQTWTGTAVPFDVTNGGFLDMNNAWAPAATVDEKALYTTSDGWQHWNKILMKTAFKRVFGFSFVSPGLGWALADNRTTFAPEPGGGIRKGDMIAVLKTTDGGQTWREIAYSKV